MVGLCYLWYWYPKVQHYEIPFQDPILSQFKPINVTNDRVTQSVITGSRAGL
jgi:hypothetical protein